MMSRGVAWQPCGGRFLDFPLRGIDTGWAGREARPYWSFCYGAAGRCRVRKLFTLTFILSHRGRGDSCAPSSVQGSGAPLRSSLSPKSGGQGG